MDDVLKQTETINPSTEYGSVVKADHAEERWNHLCGIRPLNTLPLTCRRMPKQQQLPPNSAWATVHYHTKRNFIHFNMNTYFF